MYDQSPSGTAILTLILGIVSFLGPGILTGLPAWIIGREELKRIDMGLAPAGGRTMAQIGVVLGILATVLTVLGVLVAILIFLPMVGIMQSLAGGMR